MEQWLADHRDPAGEAAVAQFISDGDASLKLTLIIAALSESAGNTYEEPGKQRDAYAMFIAYVRDLYHGAPGARTTAIAQIMYTLEEGDLLPMEPDLDHEEEQRRLMALDAGRALFKQRLLQAFGDMHKYADRNFVIGWARIVYNHVHGFQAPPTQDPARAVRDAMGQTDHFMELMQEVIDESPEAVE